MQETKTMAIGNNFYLLYSHPEKEVSMFCVEDYSHSQLVEFNFTREKDGFSFFLREEETVKDYIDYDVTRDNLLYGPLMEFLAFNERDVIPDMSPNGNMILIEKEENETIKLRFIRNLHNTDSDISVKVNKNQNDNKIINIIDCQKLEKLNNLFTNLIDSFNNHLNISYSLA